MALHIVHLEDDGPLRDILRVSLTHISPDVRMHQFVDSDSTVLHIKENLQAIDLFILDIRVPGKLDGLGVAQKIRDLGATSPIVLTSAYRKPDSEQLQTLKCEWFPKPWHILETSDILVKLARSDRKSSAKPDESGSRPQNGAGH